MDLKSLVWSKASQPAEPHTWCLGMSSQATTGWPGTDWIEDILLHRSGPQVYEQWATGRLPWTSDAMKDAWRTWASLIAGQDGQSALDTPYEGKGGTGLLDSGTCTQEHEGSFIRYLYGPDTGFEPSAGTIPALHKNKDAYEVSADMAAVFRDSPAATTLLSRLSGTRGRTIWMKQATQVLKPNFPSASDPRPDDRIGERVAATLTGGTEGTPARLLCFDASDTMPPTLRDAFQHAVLQFLSAPDRTLADAPLGQLEAERTRLSGADWLPAPGICGSPAG